MSRRQSEEYSVDAYCRMIVDANRGDAYKIALERAIKPGSVVCDIGAGLGFMTLIACEAGAARVYAIEPSQSLSLAKKEIIARGFEDSVILAPLLSTAFEPPERADVVVFDLRGVTPLFRGNVSSSRDAALRLLAPGGTMIPARDTMFAALVECPAEYAQCVDPWLNDAKRPWRDAVAVNANNTYRALLTRSALLSEPVAWHTITYGETHDEGARASIVSEITQAGVAHGIAIWFRAELLGDIGFSTAPGECGAMYGQLFLPFETPARVMVGARLHCDLQADANGDDIFWSWSGSIEDGAGEAFEFKQSTFNSYAIRHETLQQATMTETENRGAGLIDAQQQYVQSHEVLSCEVNGETVLLGLIDSEYFGLNEVGTHIWQALAHPSDLAALTESVCASFEVDEETSRRDVSALLNAMLQKSLVAKVSN